MTVFKDDHDDEAPRDIDERLKKAWKERGFIHLGDCMRFCKIDVTAYLNVVRRNSTQGLREYLMRNDVAWKLGVSQKWLLFFGQGPMEKLTTSAWLETISPKDKAEFRLVVSVGKYDMGNHVISTPVSSRTLLTLPPTAQLDMVQTASIPAPKPFDSKLWDPQGLYKDLLGCQKIAEGKRQGVIPHSFRVSFVDVARMAWCLAVDYANGLVDQDYLRPLKKELLAHRTSGLKTLTKTNPPEGILVGYRHTIKTCQELIKVVERDLMRGAKRKPAKVRPTDPRLSQILEKNLP